MFNRNPYIISPTLYLPLLITQKTIQQILSRIDILDVVGNFVKLKKRGANYLGLCPFHNERTPSFTVSPSKEIFKCFGCGKSGNTISFIMEHEKLSYVEALRWLAARYNIEVEETESTPEQKLQQQTSESLHIINLCTKILCGTISGNRRRRGDWFNLFEGTRLFC